MISVQFSELSHNEHTCINYWPGCGTGAGRPAADPCTCVTVYVLLFASDSLNHLSAISLQATAAGAAAHLELILYVISGGG